MKKFEIATFILAIVGGVLVLGKITGGLLILLLALNLLSIFYMFFSSMYFNGVSVKSFLSPGTINKMGKRKILIAQLSGVAFSVGCAAFLFYLGRWPGAAVMLFAASMFSLVGIVLFLVFLNKEIGVMKGLLIRLIICFSTTNLLFFIPLKG